MKHKKFNYYKFGLFCAVVLCVLAGIIYGIISIIKGINYRKTYEYQFVKLGYTTNEFEIIDKNVSEKYYDKLLSYKYNKDIVNLVKEKYFLVKNLDKYIDYISKNNNKELSEVIRYVNCELDVEWIDTEYETDISKENLMLVNRIYGLPKDYEPEDIEKLSLSIAYDGNKVSKVLIDNLNELISAGKNEGYTFVVSQGYRSYSDQEKIYNIYVNSYGKSEADAVAARAGHSEYQTGLSLDLQPYNKVFENAYESNEYEWLSNNAYKYGFIIRYNKDTENITQFKSSAWRLRYVGFEAASIIYEENITFEEYYAYYVIGEDNE